MRFGDYIRELRSELRWTQPEAAREIGIEQSYLSKLESGKSYPSEDVFASLVRAYKIDVNDLADKLFAADLDRLREISQVRASILSSEKDYRMRVQHWLFAGLAALMLGGACLGATFLAEDKEVTRYQYRSAGVIPEGQDTQPGDNESQGAEALRRANEQYRSLEEYRDVAFFETVPDGIETWRFFGAKIETVRSPLRWFLIPAIAMIMSALGCFFASYRAR